MGRDDAVPDDEALLAAARPKSDPVSELIFGNLRRMLFSKEVAPEKVGPYELRSPLGEGAMGTVFEAFDPVLDRRVALKLLKRRDAGAQESLLAEARALAKLSHDNVVTVHDAGSWNEQVYIVMELVDGLDLGQWLGKRGRGSEEIVLMFAAAARGLAAAHEAGLVHGDFKPSNVLVSDARVCVADFGMAHGTDPETNPSTALVVGGTPLYMAPERLTGAEPSRLSDQFAFFVSLFEALQKRSPFRGKTATALLESMHKPLVADEGDPSMPRWLRQTIAKGLDADPEKRHASMRLVAEILSRPRAAIRRRRMIGVGALAAVGLAAAIGGRLSHSAEPTRPCTGAPDKLAAVWSEARQKELRAAFDASGLSFAASSWERTAANVDRFGELWVGARTEACEATRVIGEQSVEVMDRRVACLDRRLADADALLASLARADREAITLAVDTTAGLAHLDECSDIEALLRSTPPPDAPGAAQAIAKLEAALITANANLRIGRREGMQDDLDAMRDRVDELAYPPVSKRYHGLRGELLSKLGEHDDALADLESAYREAVLDGDFRRASRYAGMLSLEHRKSGDAGRSQSWMQTGADMVRGVADRGEAKALHLRQSAQLLAINGDYPAAEGLNRAADEIFLAIEPSRSERIGILGALGRNLREQGRHEEAVSAQQQAFALATKTYGEVHPETVAAEFELASSLAIARRYDEALRTFDEAIVGAKAIPVAPGMLAMFHGGRCTALLGLGRFEEAEAATREGLALWREVHGPDHFENSVYLLNLASAQEQQKQTEAALQSSREARRVLRLHFPAEHPRVVSATVLIAKQLHAKDDTAAAVAELDPLEREGKLALLLPVQEAWARLTLADSLMTEGRWSPDQQSRARMLGQNAHDQLESLGPSVQTELTEAKKWLAENR